MKYFWVIFSVCFSLYIYGLYNHKPIYHWKNPNITVKTIEITDKIGFIYYKDYERDIERFGLYYLIKF